MENGKDKVKNRVSISGQTLPSLEAILDFIEQCRDAVDFNHPTIKQYKIALVKQYLYTLDEIKKQGRVKGPHDRRTRVYQLLNLVAAYLKLRHIHLPHRRPDGTYHFIGETIFISHEIKKDVFERYLNNQHSEYSVQYDDHFCVDPHQKSIRFRKEFNEEIERIRKDEAASGKTYFISIDNDIGCYSLHELYSERLKNISGKTLKSNDFLNQLLTVYIIKRALNGDGEATQRLYSLYQKKAIRAASSIVTRIADKLRQPQKEILLNSKKDIIKEGVAILFFIISGFSPEAIINSLASSKDNARLLIPPWIEKFYLYYLAEYIPKELKLTGNTLKDLQKLTSSEDVLFDLEILFDVYSLVNVHSKWKSGKKRIMKFLNYSFRPTNKTNLTTWLFGTPHNPMQGRYCQLLRDCIKKNYLKNLQEDSFDFLDEASDDEVEVWRHQAIEQKIYNNITCYNTEYVADDVRDELLKRGFSKRNIEIILRKLNGCTNQKIAIEFGLSERQIINICNKTKKYL